MSDTNSDRSGLAARIAKLRAEVDSRETGFDEHNTNAANQFQRFGQWFGFSQGVGVFSPDGKKGGGSSFDA